MPRKRSLHDSDTILSSGSTESSLSSSFVDMVSPINGWMYWKREETCWMKVFVHLRKNFVWLTRTSSLSSCACPLIQIAVAHVEESSFRSFLITGPSDEVMELFLYQPEQQSTWRKALQEASKVTQLCLQELSHEALSRHRLFIPSNCSLKNGQEYRGTLVDYREECKGSRWRRFWNSLRLRQSVRKRLESMVDRFDTPPTSRSLCSYSSTEPIHVRSSTI